MSAVMTPRRIRRGHDRDRAPSRQTSLFGQVVQPLPREAEPAVALSPETAPAEPAAVAAPSSRTAEPAAVAAPSSRAAEPSLARAISSLWDGLLAGEPGACPVCGEAMQPRESAAAGVVAGRCGSCSATIG